MPPPSGTPWAPRYSRAVQVTPAEKRPPPLGQWTGPWRWHCWRASSVPAQRTPLISTRVASGLPAQYQVSWAKEEHSAGTSPRTPCQLPCPSAATRACHPRLSHPRAPGHPKPMPHIP